MKCPKSSQSCQTGDYQIKVINKIPSPSDMIANQVLKPTAFDKFTTYFMPVFCGVMWGLILYAILFS